MEPFLPVVPRFIRGTTMAGRAHAVQAAHRPGPAPLHGVAEPRSSRICATTRATDCRTASVSVRKCQ